MNRLKGKRALITGGTTGIGLETAREFLNEGARVAITSRNQASLEAARKELDSDVLTFISDAGDAAAQKLLADSVRQAFGALDVLFINAGFVDLRPLEQIDEAAFDRSLSVILKGPLFLIQALLPVFANPASIVLNGSINAHIGMPNTSIYGAGCPDLPRPHALRRTRVARHTRERGQRRANLDCAAQQCWIFRGATEVGSCLHQGAGSDGTIR